MHFSTFLTTCLLASTTNALFFYLDGTNAKCFYEELPKDTLVVGTFRAEAYDTNTQSYSYNPNLQIKVTVDETFDQDHRVVSQTSAAGTHEKPSKFTFSAADSGLHRLCFTPTGSGAVSLQGWFSGHDSAKGGTRLMLDLAIGESSKIESEDKGKIDSIVGKVRELNARLADIRREQIFQREREAEFRDQSESTNGKIVRWTLIQLFVLGATCAWQLSHLRSFFIKQKLT